MRGIQREGSGKRSLAKVGGRNVKDNRQPEHRAERLGGGVLAVLLKSSVWLGGALLSSERMSCLCSGVSPRKTGLENRYHPPFKTSVPFIGSDDKGCL